MAKNWAGLRPWIGDVDAPESFGPVDLVAEGMERVGLVVELAQMLELEAQHQRAVGLQIQGRVLDEGLDVARPSARSIRPRT